MKLSGVNLFEFKSIRDSGQFNVGDVTCLVGKNEAGKTAILQALYRLNPVVPEHGKFDVTDDYPRSDVEDYRQDVESKKRGPATVVKATFELDKEEIEKIEATYGQGVLKSTFFTLAKGYSGGDQKTAISYAKQIHFDEKIAGTTLLESAGITAEITASWATLEELYSIWEDVASQKTIAYNSAAAKLVQVTDEDEKRKAQAEAELISETSASKQGRTTLATLVEEGLMNTVWGEVLANRLPKFLYFDEYYQMEGNVNIEQLKDRQAKNALLDSDRPMLGLIELARLNLDDMTKQAERTEAIISKLEGASNHLSKQVLKYWSQNRHLKVKFDVRPARSGDPAGMNTGHNLLGRVEDSVHDVSTPLGSRSRGFVWFFSFVAWFSQQKKANDALVLLLDEPGLVLHGKAQADLLSYIEKELRPHHQVIYSTHSPFMVDAAHFDRVRIVEDKSMDADSPEDLAPEQRGTKVSTDVLSVSEGSLFPLQGALGYGLCQTLFVGPNCLIVEGPSDLLYLNAMSSVLERKGRTGLSTSWTLTPAGGADKVPTFVALLGAQKGFKLAALIDVQQKDRQKIENLYKEKLLKKKNVLTFGDFTGKAEADIEDMFEPGLYVNLVNSEYALKDLLSLADLPHVEQRRILVVLEEHFASKALLRHAQFNHYRPARYFSEKLSEMKISDATLDRFENAFKAVNALL